MHGVAYIIGFYGHFRSLNSINWWSIACWAIMVWFRVEKDRVPGKLNGVRRPRRPPSNLHVYIALFIVKTVQ